MFTLCGSTIGEMDKDVKEQLINSVNNIKSKIRMIKNAEDEADIKYKKVFKPIIDPLSTLIKEKDSVTNASNDNMDKLNSSIDYENFVDSVPRQSSSYEDSEYYDYAEESPKPKDMLQSLEKDDVMNIYDNINIPFGIHTKNDKLMIGNTTVCLSAANNDKNSDKKYVVTIKDKHYTLTPGLKELLIRSKPNFSLITEDDKIVYKDILCMTNAHKRDYSTKGQIKGDKGAKYKLIIKPLFIENAKENCSTLSKNKKVGGYIRLFKKYKKNTDYVYWDDPNELVERLKLLIASKNAGNNIHDNEIVSIIEELKEAGIVKG